MVRLVSLSGGELTLLTVSSSLNSESPTASKCPRRNTDACDGYAEAENKPRYTSVTRSNRLIIGWENIDVLRIRLFVAGWHQVLHGDVVFAISFGDYIAILWDRVSFVNHIDFF